MHQVRVKDLNVLAVYVTDLKQAMDFYGKHLGFEHVEDMPPGVLMKAGTVTLYLEASRKRKRDEAASVSEFSPCFATNGVKAAYQSLKAAGVKIAGEYQEFGPEFAIFRVSDPDGNLIEFAGAP